MISILFLYMLLASTFTLGKGALYYASPCFLIAVRMIIGGGLLLIYVRLFDKKHFFITKNQLPILLQAVVFHVYIAYVLEFWALQYISSVKSCLWYSLSPFITAFLSQLIFKERLSQNQKIGLLIGMSGFIPMFFSSSGETSLHSSFIQSFAAQGALFISVCAASYGWILMRQFVKNPHYLPLMFNGIAMVGGGFLSLLTSFLVEGLVPHISSVPIYTKGVPGILTHLLGPQLAGISMFFGYVVLLIIVANIIFYNFYGALLKYYSATLLSLAGLTTPLFAALFGWFVYGETLGKDFFFTFIAICLGLYVFYADEIKK